MSRKLVGILVMAYGTPDHIAELPAYYTHIRQGRPPSAAQLEELGARYRAIGGSSPLGRVTRAQAEGLASELQTRFPDIDFRSIVGFKHARPFIEDAVAALHALGIRTVVPVVMAPHDSGSGIRSYFDRAAQAAENLGMNMCPAVSGWYRQPGFIQFWAMRIGALLSSLPPAELRRTLVVFSAHSLPIRVLDGDPYPAQVTDSADLIAAAAGVGHHTVAWQSAGRTPEPWLGPDIRDVVRDAWDSGAYRDFIVCPIGFVSDHLEVLYDDDIECRALIETLGGRYLRPPMPNADRRFISCLSDAVAGSLSRTELVAA